MIEYYLGAIYKKIFVCPVATRLSKSASPNTFTFLACLSGICVAPLLMNGNVILASILLLLSGYLDTLDGAIARASSRCTQKGTILDIVFDRIVEVAVIVGLFGVDPIHRAWPVIGMLGSILICVTTFLVIGIFMENSSHKSFYYSRGIMERPEAFIFFITMIWIPTYFNEVAMLFTILVLITSFFHFYRFENLKE